MDDREVVTARGGRILAITPVRQDGAIAGTAQELGLRRVVPAWQRDSRLRSELSIRRPAERGERVVVDGRVVHDRRRPHHRRITAFSDVTAIIADTRLRRPWRIAACPTGGGLVHTDDVGITAHVHKTLRCERRLDAEVDRRDTRNQPDALPRAAAAGDRPSRASLVTTGHVDEEEARPDLVAGSVVPSRAIRRDGIRNRHRVAARAVQGPPIHRPRIPAQHAFLRAGFRRPAVPGSQRRTLQRPAPRQPPWQRSRLRAPYRAHHERPYAYAAPL